MSAFTINPVAIDYREPDSRDLLREMDPELVAEMERIIEKRECSYRMWLAELSPKEKARMGIGS